MKISNKKTGTIIISNYVVETDYEYRITNHVCNGNEPPKTISLRLNKEDGWEEVTDDDETNLMRDIFDLGEYIEDRIRYYEKQKDYVLGCNAKMLCKGSIRSLHEINNMFKKILNKQ